ncbi:MAG: glycosyltransferase [Pseudomonadota bacterium]
MSNILIISPVPIHPNTAGNRARISTLVENLEELGHTVWFLHIEQETADVEAAANYWGERLVRVPYSKPKMPGWLGFLKRQAAKLGLGFGFNLPIDAWYDPKIDAYVDKTLASREFAAVFVEYVFFSKALERVARHVPRILDTHDVFANRYQFYQQQGMAPTWFSCTKSAEAKALNRASTVVAIQHNEATHFRNLSDTPVVTVGHSIPLNPQSWDRVVPKRLLMVGSANQINLQGLEWFVQKVLPIIRAQHPSTILAVAGSIGQNLAASDALEILGRVDDLGDTYAQAQIVINPMQFGTGLKIKSIEALAYRRPLVTTATGAEGLENGIGNGICLGETPQGFADHTNRLLGDIQACEVVADQGHQFLDELNRSNMATLGELIV